MVEYVGERSPWRLRNPFIGETSIAVILVLVIAWRLFVAISFAPLLHEDQVFQYLEPAHRLVYGYGFIPWEYRFGLRNWLLPGSLAIILVTLRELGIDQPRFYIPILQGVGALLSISSVYSSYVIGRNVYSKQAGMLAAIFVGFWSELNIFATGLIPEVLAMYCGLGAFALWTDARGRGHVVAIGILLGLCAVLRLQYAPVSLTVLLLLWLSSGWRKARLAGVSAAAVVVAAGMLDYFFWGMPFASFYNNVLFNFVYDISSVFGERTIIYYFGTLALHSLMLFAVAGIYGLWHWKRFFPLLLVIGAVLVPHSLIGHKEYRFVVLVIPLLLIILSCGAIDAARWQRRFTLGFSPTYVVCAAVLMASAYLAFIKGEFRREPRFDAAIYLSELPDVRSVVDFSTYRWRSGGYSYMHANIPLLFRDDLSPHMQANLADVASHILVQGGDPPVPGFKTLKTIGDIKILSQIVPRASYMKPETDYRSPLFLSVDGKFVPNVSPWPRNDFRVKG